jgi:2,3-bisphosphoglycerate-independent phosphoglycerate mutase
MTPRASFRPVVLCILDGFGCRAEGESNAIALAKKPNFDRLFATCPVSQLDASGRSVGLPKSQMGNSEVGHMTIGAGRVILQDFPRVDAAIEDGSLAENPALLGFMAKLKRVGGACHLMGLVSPGGVHSHQRHLATLAILLARQGIPVWVHAFLDGRDTPPESAGGFLKEFLDDVASEPLVRIGTISGRYYAMDRDKRWERTAKAYAAIADAKGKSAATPAEAIKSSYARKVTDEFVEPVALSGYPGMKDEDGVLMANFRADRVRQILRALLLPGFDGFKCKRRPKISAALGLVNYADDLVPHMSTLFPPQDPKHMLGEIISAHGLRQLRIAETEKYAHVTYFLNGGREEPYPGEDRILIPSPKVATYDLQPEMSARPVTDALVKAIESGTYDFMVVNFANPDMVGHTGIVPAAIKAVETVDACVGRIAAAIEAQGGVLLITADHGNIELMRDPDTGEPHTAHTTLPVPFILVNGARLGAGATVRNGSLADIAPTVLMLLGLEQPREMTGQSLVILEGAEESHRATA